MPMIDDISKAPTRELHLAEGRRDLDQVPRLRCRTRLPRQGMAALRPRKMQGSAMGSRIRFSSLQRLAP